MESEVIETLANATVNGTLGALKLKSSAGFNASAQIGVDDVCASKPCNFAGKCIAKGTGYKCDCKLFRFGDHCQDGISLAAGIIAIVFGCIAVAIIIFAIVRCCCWVSKKDSYRAETRSSYTTNVSMDSFHVKNGGHIESKDNPGFDDNNCNTKSLDEKSTPI
ncbi:hypothetical protein AC249_AIPGENE6307 [Exaiptasia diaphana]|nr:hypothetical protein AC249_AIPGENE6307 [Exaiptasia diaphana]